MNLKTFAYKGSKRKLLNNILHFIREIDSETFFDGFSGSGVVSAFARSNGLRVTSNDLNPSCYIAGSVFLNGFNKENVEKHLVKMNALLGKEDWITANYSGEIYKNGISRPNAFIKENAMLLDSAREYVENLDINIQDKNALIFSIILSADSTINNTSDQKSSFNKWLDKSQKKINFICPTLIQGKIGNQTCGDIFSIKKEKYDCVYLDPPYSNGVLYSSCYHISDSIVLWDKPELNKDYALARPERASFRNKKPRRFYSKKNIEKDFHDLLRLFADSKRIIISYSDAPRNLIKIDRLMEICKKYGKLNIFSIDHRLCTQFKSQNKVSEKLIEYFFIID